MIVDAIKQRLVSKDQAMITFAVIVFVIHIWSIYNLLVEVPAWILRLSMWELAGVVAYTLVFALVESLVILFFLVIIAAILPARFFRQKFIAISAVFVFLAAIWVIPIHLYEDTFRSGGAPGALVLIVMVIISFIVGYYFVMKSTRLEKSIISIMQRVTILAMLYIMIDLIAIVIVVSRNVVG